MSSVPPDQQSPTTSAEDSAPSPTRGTGAISRGNSSNLYLVTFLATLFLLLFVSCSIVLRSYLMRRRYRRQVNQALANGIVLTPRAPGSRKKRFGIRPRMYESWIAPLYVGNCGWFGASVSPQDPDGGKEYPDVGDEKMKERGMTGSCKGTWGDMMPVTVQTVIVKRRTKDPNATQCIAPASPTLSGVGTPAPAPPQQASSMSLRPLLTNISSRSHFFTRSSGGTHSPASPILPTPTTPSSPDGYLHPQHGVLSFPHPHAAEARAVRNSRVHHQNESRDAPTPTSRRHSAAPALSMTSPSGARERRESTTSWRTFLAPNPSLPLPAPASSNSGAAARWQEEREGRGQARGPLGRLVGRFSGQGEANETPGLPNAPESGGATPAAAPPPGRVRTEMLQISVLVAMPSLDTSRLYGDAGVVKRGYGGYASQLAATGAGGVVGSGNSTGGKGKKGKRRTSLGGGMEGTMTEEGGGDDEIVEIPGEGDDEDDEEDEEEEDGPPPLPELVLGVTRLTYRPSGNRISSTASAVPETGSSPVTFPQLTLTIPPTANCMNRSSLFRSSQTSQARPTSPPVVPPSILVTQPQPLLSSSPPGHARRHSLPNPSRPRANLTR